VHLADLSVGESMEAPGISLEPRVVLVPTRDGAAPKTQYTSPSFAIQARNTLIS